MEISEFSNKRQFSLRLLTFFSILCLISLSPAFAEKLNWIQIKKLELTPATESVFVQQDLAFILTLPGVAPENIQTSLKKLPDSVQFLSSKRADFIDADRDIGTRLEFWFSFSEAGTITLPPLTLTISGYRYTIPFAPVVVNENPETVAPKMRIQFISGVNLEQDGTYSAVLGENIYFTVNLKYILQIAKLDWNLQKNSIFSEIKRFGITEGKPRGRELFSKEVPVVSFEWKPLVAGEWTLPEIKITAVRYNGSRALVEMPEIKVNVIEAEKNTEIKKQISNDDDVFAYAFTENNNEIEEDINKVLNKEQCKTLAELRSKERHSFPFSKNRTTRFNYEKQFGITADTPEPSLNLLYLCLCFCLILTILSVVFIIYKKKIFILFLSLLCVVILISIASSSKLHSTYGIFTGGDLSPIPEESALVPQHENGGLRVRILEKTSTWSYIVFNETGGWVLNDSLFIIR